MIMDKISSEAGLLHLRPRSRTTQRVWHIGQTESTADGTDASELRLAVLPDRHETFISLKSILAQLLTLARPEQRQGLAGLEGDLREACPGPAEDNSQTRRDFLTDSVTFAIMRRISRESFHTGRIIDRAARVINATLSRIPNCTHVHVDHIDRLDRPTLKMLTRAMLLLELEHGFSWVWHSTSDPTATGVSNPDDTFLISRQALLRQMIGIVSPTLRRHAHVLSVRRPDRPARGIGTHEVAAALTMQNYDACFLWCDALSGGGVVAEVVEALRLKALAAINVGMAEEALRTLRLAEEMATGPGRRAHLACLQGLIEAKRCYDLSRSTAHYERGLRSLEAGPGEGEDLALERGWLLNGIALDEAILWRRNPGAMGHYTKALDLEREAFDLVRDGTNRARQYLQYNLAANVAFLMEMRGHYDLAIDLLRQSFDFGVGEAPVKKHHWRSHLSYRIGILHYRGAELDSAYRLLQDAAEHNARTETWVTQEQISRALGAIALDRRAFAEASGLFSRGLEICRNARSAQGTREHARGLIAALLGDGKERQAREVCDGVSSEEGLTVLPPERCAAGRWGKDLLPTRPPPKLPAYFPEIDLEEIPAIDINRFLGNVPSPDSPTARWRH
jgi:hypothetical protein